MSENQQPRVLTDLELDERGGSGGCMGFAGRLFAALLVITIATGLSLLAVALLALRFGYGLETPQRLEQSEGQVATLEAQSRSIQTQVVELNARSSAGEEALDALEAQMVQLESRAGEFDRGTQSIATALVEVRAVQVQVSVFATTEASRAALLDDLAQRSARVERFLQRLSDIAADSDGGLGSEASASPTPTATPQVITATPIEPTSILTATPTATPADTATPLVVTVVVTAQPTDTPQVIVVTATPEASKTPTATTRPTRTATPRLTEEP